MTLPKRLRAILLPLAITACATVEPPKIVSDACLNFRSISFAELPQSEQAKPRDAQSDDGNQADTPETVSEIGTHNAKYDALCSSPER